MFWADGLGILHGLKSWKYPEVMIIPCLCGVPSQAEYHMGDGQPCQWKFTMFSRRIVFYFRGCFRLSFLFKECCNLFTCTVWTILLVTVAESEHLRATVVGWCWSCSETAIYYRYGYQYIPIMPVIQTHVGCTSVILEFQYLRFEPRNHGFFPTCQVKVYRFYPDCFLFLPPSPSFLLPLPSSFLLLPPSSSFPQQWPSE